LPQDALSEDEQIMLAVWSRPLIQTYQQMRRDEFAAKARSVLGVDGPQVQGLARNLDPGLPVTLITMVECYAALQRKISNEDEYIKMLRNAVYNQAKAMEVKKTLEVLAKNWLSFKENLKSMKSPKPVV
jgi:hypothetical protein